MTDWPLTISFVFAILATRATILLAALAIDWLVGEPDLLWRRVPHPVVMFGRVISALPRDVARCSMCYIAVSGLSGPW